ncbi:MAG TPA: ATP-binding protein, partial [Armatimonadota bacterium]|nr:ATP-binding protein [Armatimonadota bacterium]
YVRDNWVNSGEVCSFEELEAKLAGIIEELEDEGKDTYHSHHIATIRKMRNRLTNIPARCPGLITRGRVGEGEDIPLQRLEDRDIFVVDVSGLNTQGQDLVFHKVIECLGRMKERDELGVDHVIVFVDELNKFAPRLGESILKRTLIDISARGRYIGFVLFGAQQFRSKVDDEVVGNTATSLYGRMDAEELINPPYRMFSDTVKDKLSALEKGELLLRHPHFKQAIFVRFPVPSVLRGKDGLLLWPAHQVDNSQRVFEELKSLDPSAAIRMEEVQRAVDGLDEDTVLRVLEKVRRRHDPRRAGFLWSLFKAVLRSETGRGE